ncbi:MAG TPA: rhodanese-like domain-containing protein [Anaerolineaceae bacterium]
MAVKTKITRKSRNIPAWVWGVLSVAVLIVFVMIFFQQPLFGKSQALPAEISIQKAAEMRDQGAFILDVREQSEWDEYHIPGATLIPLGQVQSRVNEVPKDKPIVVVCRSGNRSKEGRDKLAAAGFTQVTSMAGGVSQWRSQGLPVVPGR